MIYLYVCSFKIDERKNAHECAQSSIIYKKTKSTRSQKTEIAFRKYVKKMKLNRLRYRVIYVHYKKMLLEENYALAHK